MLADTVATYDAMSPNYDQCNQNLLVVEEMVVNSLLRHLTFTDILDVGCGTGRWTLRLAAQGRRVTGVDASPGMLAVARRKAEEQKLPVRFRVESVTRLSAADASFDVVLSALALAHVKELALAVQEMARVLRPGGHLLVSELHPDIQACWGPEKTIEVEGKVFPFPQYHSTVSEYVDAVRGAGLDLLAAIDVPMPQSVRGLATGALVVLGRRRRA